MTTSAQERLPVKSCERDILVSQIIHIYKDQHQPTVHHSLIPSPHPSTTSTAPPPVISGSPDSLSSLSTNSSDHLYSSYPPPPLTSTNNITGIGEIGTYYNSTDSLTEEEVGGATNINSTNSIHTHNNSGHRRGIGISPNSSVPIPIPSQMQTAVMAHTEASTSPSLGDISELLTNVSTSAQILQNSGRSFLLAPSTISSEDSNGTYINWLYDLYGPTGGNGAPTLNSQKTVDKSTNNALLVSSTTSGSSVSLGQIGGAQSPDSMGGVMIPKSEGSPTGSGSGHILSSSAPASTDGASLMAKEVEFHKEPVAVFRAQERYMIILGAPTSIAQRQGDDTLTYLNKGQFYSLYFRANNEMNLPPQVKSIIYLSFLDESDRNVEHSHWQYWYDLQANPNQKAFDIDRKNCEGLLDKPQDLGYNAALFTWDPRLGARVILRINCLSTEFSSQKGVKGLPLHVAVDTYENTENASRENGEPSHRAYCRVKIFRDKGAERKNKDETKSVERRLQKFIRSYNSVNLDAEIGPATVFHPPCKETTLTPTSTFGPKPYVFKLGEVRIGDHTPAEGGLLSMNTNSFLENIKEREMKRSFTRTLTQTKEDLDHLEVGPRHKAKKIHTHPMTTIYVRKEEEKVYNAISLRELTVDELKIQISNKYDIPEEMIRFIYKKTKKGLIVRFDDELVSRFDDEDDFIIELDFDNQKGHFDLYIRY